MPEPRAGLVYQIAGKYTYREAALILNCSYGHIRNLMSQHHLPRAFHVKGRVRPLRYALISGETLQVLARLTRFPL